MSNILLENRGSNPHYDVEMRSDIGRRAEQQDRAYAYTDADIAFAIVCDGMGGGEMVHWQADWLLRTCRHYSNSI